MNDFTMILLALGRGIIKLLISTLVGFGVGLLVLGIATAGKQDLWRGPPPGEIFMGIGAGLLSGGGTLLALFFIPWFSKRQAERRYLEEEPPILARPAPRSMRRETHDEPPPYPTAKPARHEPGDSMPPTVRPIPPTADEPGGFFEK